MTSKVGGNKAKIHQVGESLVRVHENKLTPPMMGLVTKLKTWGRRREEGPRWLRARAFENIGASSSKIGEVGTETAQRNRRCSS